MKSLHKIGGLSNASSSKSSSKFEKSYKEMKEEAKLNENVQHNMPYIQVPRTEQINAAVNKKKFPNAESDPKTFAQLLSEKLEKLVLDADNKQKNSHNACQQQQQIIESTNDLFLSSKQDSDIEAERMIDEHVNRVFKHTTIMASTTTTNNVADINKLSPPPKHNHHQHHHQQQQQQQINNKKSINSNNKSAIDLQATLNNTCGSYLNLTNASLSIPINTTLMSTSTSFLNKTNYQLMAQCKEVDIDQQQLVQQQQQQQKQQQQNNHQQYRSTTNYHDPNYDSGVSMRSVASIERVSDWLATSNCNNYQANATPTTTPHHHQQQQQQITNSNVKTTVAYYLPGEDVAYISSFNGTMVTLAQFKQLITKKGHFRYFFKTKSDLLDEECIVYQEVTDESSIVPMFNNKVIAKIEKSQ